MIRIHNIETNEVIDREMTDVEYAEFLNPTPTPGLEVTP